MSCAKRQRLCPWLEYWIYNKLQLTIRTRRAGAWYTWKHSRDQEDDNKVIISVIEDSLQAFIRIITFPDHLKRPQKILLRT